MVDCVTVVEGLSQKEKNSILHVLQRDEELRYGQEQKISNLKKEINQIRMCGVLRGGDDQTKMCLRCRGVFGVVFNRGTLCPSCRFKVCKNCQEVMFNGSWLCKLCYKQRQLKWLTGEWTASFEQNPLRKWASGSDLLKSSMKLVPGSTSIDIDEPTESHGNERQGRKVSRNGVGGGRSDENRARVAAPKEGDQMKLSELFNVLRVKKTDDGQSPPSETQIRRVTSRRYSESDSDSSSNSDADVRSTSTAPSVTESELDCRRIDSPQSLESPPPKIIEPPRLASVDETVQPIALKKLESKNRRLDNEQQRPKAAPRSPKPAARRKVKSEHFETGNEMNSSRPRQMDRRERPLPSPEKIGQGRGPQVMSRSMHETSERVINDNDKQDSSSIHSVELSLHVAKTRESLDKKYEVEKSRSQASLNRPSDCESDQFVRPKSRERIVKKSAESLSKELKHGANNSDMDIPSVVDVNKQDRNSGADISSVHSGSRSDSSIKSSGSKDTLISNRSAKSDRSEKDSLKSIPDVQEPSKDLPTEENDLMVSITVPRAGSPYSISMDSLPSSHPSPTNLRHSLGESSNPESSDTDSLSRYGNRPNGASSQGGSQSNVNRDNTSGTGGNDFVVEEISKVHFKRVSKMVGNVGVFAKMARSPKKNDSEVNGLETEQNQTEGRGAGDEEGGGLPYHTYSFTNNTEVPISGNVTKSIHNETYGDDSVFEDLDSNVVGDIEKVQLFSTAISDVSEANVDAGWNSNSESPFPQDIYERRAGNYTRFAFVSEDNLDSGDDLIDDPNVDNINDQNANYNQNKMKKEVSTCPEESEADKSITIQGIPDDEMSQLSPKKKELKAMGSLDLLLSEQGDVVDGCDLQLEKEYQDALKYEDTDPDFQPEVDEELIIKETKSNEKSSPKESDQTKNKIVEEMNNNGHKYLTRLSVAKCLQNNKQKSNETPKKENTDSTKSLADNAQVKPKLTMQDSLDVLIVQQGEFLDTDTKNVEFDSELLEQLERQFTQELDAQKSDGSLQKEYSYLGVQHNVKNIATDKKTSTDDQEDDIDGLVGNAKQYLNAKSEHKSSIKEKDKPMLPHIAVLQESSPESSDSDMLSVIDEVDEHSDMSDNGDLGHTDLDVASVHAVSMLDKVIADEGSKGRFKKSKFVEKKIQSSASGGDFNCQKAVQNKYVDKKAQEKYKKIHDHWLAVEKHEADLLDTEELDKDSDDEHIEMASKQAVVKTDEPCKDSLPPLHIPKINVTNSEGIDSPDILIDEVVIDKNGANKRQGHGKDNNDMNAGIQVDSHEEVETMTEMKTSTSENARTSVNEEDIQSLTEKVIVDDGCIDVSQGNKSYLGASVNDSDYLCHSISDMSCSTAVDFHDSINVSRALCNTISDVSAIDDVIIEYNVTSPKYIENLTDATPAKGGELEDNADFCIMRSELGRSTTDSDRQCDSLPDMCDLEVLHSSDNDEQCNSIPDEINEVYLQSSDTVANRDKPVNVDTNESEANVQNDQNNGLQNNYHYLGASINDNVSLCQSIRSEICFSENNDIHLDGDSHIEVVDVDKVVTESDKFPPISILIESASLRGSINETRARCHSVADDIEDRDDDFDTGERCHSIPDELEIQQSDVINNKHIDAQSNNAQLYKVPLKKNPEFVKSSAQFRSQINLLIDKSGKVTPPANTGDIKFFEPPPEKPPRLHKVSPSSSIPSSPEYISRHFEDKLESPRTGLSRESPQTISECSVSQDDSGHVSGGSRGATPEHKRTDSSYSQSSLPSTLSTVTDDDEDIDRVVAKVKQQAGSRSNLLSVFGDSRESIASYYSDAGDITYSNVPITGEILFSLNYNYKTSMLEVGIKQCREIAVADNRRNRSDPYVKTYLLPDRTRSGKRKTKVKKHTVNPTFEETLKYSITKSELENRTLWVTVWHNDRFGRNAFLGEVTINFDYFKFEDPFPKWYILQERMDAPPQSMMIYKGDISICIRYVPADKHNAPSTSTGKQKKENIKGQLQVMVKEARNLTAVRSNGFSDPFCKGYLLPERHKSSKQKTVVMRKDCNPVWNHTFVFEDVTLMELRERCLELTIWDYEKLTSNDFLGGVRLNLGTGMSQGKTVDWMDARGEEMSMWQAMLDRPNLWIDGALILRPNMDKRKF